MNSVQDRRHRHRGPSAAQLERDAALVRVSRTRRFVIGGAAALSAGIAALVSAVAPGHTLGAKTAEAATGTSSASGSGRSTAHASTASKKMPPLAKPSDLGLSGPRVGPTAPGSSSSSSGNTGNTGNTGGGASGNSGGGGNTGNTGPAGNSGGSAGSGNSGSAGNSGPAAAAPAQASPPAPVTSGGS